MARAAKAAFLIEIFIGVIVDSHTVAQKLLLKWQEGRGSDLEADQHLYSSSKAVWKEVVCGVLETLLNLSSSLLSLGCALIKYC